MTEHAAVEPVGTRQRALDVTPAVAANIGLRGVMEGGIVAAFAYWGYESGSGAARRTLGSIGAPAVAFGVWGAVDFRQLGRFAEPARLVEELAISGLAVTALWAARQRAARRRPWHGVRRAPRVGLRNRGTPAECVAGLVGVRRHTNAGIDLATRQHRRCVRIRLCAKPA